MIEYDKHDWTAHLFDVEGSMVREIIGRVSICVLWAALVVALDRLTTLELGRSATVHTLLGLALGLLLVFRTNASYDRYWEGRRQWGAIINTSRNLARATRIYLAPAAPDLAAPVLLWTAAFARAVLCGLRQVAPDLGTAVARLPAPEVEAARAAPNVSFDITVRIGTLLAEARARGALSDIVLALLDADVRRLIDALGACERIKNTPLPFVYVVHIRRSLILYCFTLPFALINLYGWWTILVALFISYIYFGIEEIGVEIENPFGHDSNDLPLESFCATIERDVLSSLGPDPVPAGDRA